MKLARPCCRIPVALLILSAVASATAQEVPSRSANDRRRGPITVTDYLPPNFATDGSVSYQPKLQQALDAAAKTGREVVFPPLTYLLDDPAGLRIASGMTLHLYGAKFVLSEDIRDDGQAFLGEAVTDINISGGEIVGRNDRWPDGVNLRGLYFTGPCQRVRIRDMHLRDLSSNGVGIFAASHDEPARDIWLTDTMIQNCCNKYGDYVAPPGELRGPEKGSTRLDQGLVAFYFVHDFSVRGCRFADARSDGTHFFRCRAGQFVDNKVYRAKMGGYFLESCEEVLAANCLIKDNGSRGVTIERGSVHCTLQNCTIQGSGREGLWIPDSRQCIVIGNLFIKNGRKPNTPRQIWNANITINEAAPAAKQNEWTPGTQDYLIANNAIETDSSQIAAIRIVTTPRLRQIVVKNNILLGANRRIQVEGEEQGEVRLIDNNDEDN